MPTERRIRIGDWLVPYDDATKPVTLKRTLVDILAGTPGDPQNCMNSQCIRAQRNARVFPHPVLIVSTIKSRVYIVDRLDEKTGLPAHAVRYELTKRDGRLIAEHDRFGTGLPGDLTLRVPYDPKGSPRRDRLGNRYGDGDGDSTSAGGGTHPPMPGKGRPKPKDRRPVTSLGAQARFRVAVGGGTVPSKWPKPKPPKPPKHKPK